MKLFKNFGGHFHEILIFFFLKLTSQEKKFLPSFQTTIKWGGDDDVSWALMTHLKLYQVSSMTSQNPKRTNLFDR